MPDERTYYVIGADGCRFEGMTKEQILTAITEAVESHTISDVDTGFVTKIKEQNRNVGLKFWIGTQAEYNAITTPDEDTFYIISDDQSYEVLGNAISGLTDSMGDVSDALTELSGTVNGYSEAIENLQTASGNYAERFLMYDLTEGWVLLDTAVPYGASQIAPFSFPHGEDYPSFDISSWKMVKVVTDDNYEVLCNVFKKGNDYIIEGASSGGTTNNTRDRLILINITCTEDTTQDNYSTSTLITSSQTIISEQAIKKIIGVGRF